MLEKLKWPIASLTLLTIPIAFQFSINTEDELLKNVSIFMGMSPIWIGLVIETVIHFRITAETGEAPEKGSPTGNILAVILGALFFLIIVIPVVWTMGRGLIEIWF